MRPFIAARVPLLAIALLCIAAALFMFMRLVWSIAFAPAKAWRIAEGFDNGANAAANGDPDETISSRAAKARQLGRRWGCVLCKLLDALATDHCNNSIERDRGRRLAP